jgi:hypothetical protein
MGSAFVAGGMVSSHQRFNQQVCPRQAAHVCTCCQDSDALSPVGAVTKLAGVSKTAAERGVQCRLPASQPARQEHASTCTRRPPRTHTPQPAVDNSPSSCRASTSTAGSSSCLW